MASSISKMFSILDLFKIGNPVLSGEDIIAGMDCSRPQAYRYLKALCDAGFLARSAGSYRLGARAIELDYIVRESDPLLKAAVPAMQDVRRDTGCDVLLTSLVGERIITIHHESGMDPTTVSYGRGRAMPLFRGAGSKTILASLPFAKAHRLYQLHYAADPSPVLGVNWEEVSRSLKQIKKLGHAISEGELDPENVGISAPIVFGNPPLHASVVLVLGQVRYKTTDRERIVHIVKNLSANINKTLLLN
ncbi:IclR family transcriptional regulator [Rhizobium sp. SJZ105]|uniref:IclR family transcriptional regulator n=1 Tax=Rhizobium sp. SJZ105 TaxID=2572678 RepID=UPI0011A6A6BE|nr:helix-turn-helix domain-containing protein [Rhizobium sp. SJZ105]TWC76452.1 IclR family transcriptional regulator [Rhizobium sp. SJZ105]